MNQKATDTKNEFVHILPNLRHTKTPMRLNPLMIMDINPLECPRCNGTMHAIAFIENNDVIQKILKHQGLWHMKHRQRLMARRLKPLSFTTIYQLPAWMIT